MAAREAFTEPVRRQKLLPPPLERRWVPRPRLMARLGESVEQPLTLVVAPAGFGKTTLVAQWLAGLTMPAAWLTLDPGDADARRFVAHVLAALESIIPLPDMRVGDLLRAPGAVPMADVGSILADDLFGVANDVVMVMDDAHAVTSPEVFGFLTQFLALIPPRVHLVLASRTDLPLAIARLRSHGRVNDLRAAELRFTGDEAHALVTAFSPVAVSAATAARLQEQTEGWVTGLLLAAQALTVVDNPDQVNAVLEDRHHVMQFLVEEVLANQPPERQDFLLRTSLTERICAELADVLLDQPAAATPAVLDRLVDAGLFLEPVGEERGWYRYHPLFRQLLRHQATIRFGPVVVAELHARAAGWYARQDLIDDAISHLLAAGDLAACADLVEHSLHLALTAEDWPAVERWIRLLPNDVVHARPALLLARGWVAHLSGRSAPLRAILSDIEARLDTIGPELETAAALRAEATVLRIATLLPIEQNPEESQRIARHALAHLPPDHRFPIGLAHGYLGIALQALGQETEAVRYLGAMAEREAERIDAGSIRALLGLIFVHRQAANFAECEKVARHTLTLAERNGLAVTTGWAHLFLGWIAYERDDLAGAKDHFAEVIVDYRRVHVSCVREATFGTALALQAQGQPVAADSAVQRLIEIVIDAAALEVLPVVYGFEARLALLRRDVAAAARWQAGADVGIDSNTLHAFEHALLTKAKVLLAEGTPESLEAAAQALATLQRRAAAAHHSARLVEIWVVTALVREAQAQPEAAVEALRQSLAIAERGGFYRTFVDLGPAFGSLLRRTHTQLDATPLLTRLLDDDATRTVSGPAEPARTPSVLKLLTPRECDVLDGLGRRRSYQEIADELFISPGTVKRHAGSIYAKLGVGSRREALAVAESLGWHPSG